jgi:hypothetical protein
LRFVKWFGPTDLHEFWPRAFGVRGLIVGGWFGGSEVRCMLVRGVEFGGGVLGVCDGVLRAVGQGVHRRGEAGPRFE